MGIVDERKPQRNRVWEIQSQCYYNGRPIWTEEIVTEFIKILEQEKNDQGKPILQKWAWCLHNHDKYTEYDENDEHFWYLMDDVPGETMENHSPEDRIPDHIHLVLQFANARYDTALCQIIRSNLVPDFSVRNFRLPKARFKAFLAMATYLSHKSDREQYLKKYRYPDKDVHCSDGFDYTYETEQYLIYKDIEIAKIKNNRNYLADRLVDQLERGEITIEETKVECKKLKGFSYFLRNEKIFRAARAEYIKKTYKMSPRMNIYIHGGSGTGKSTFTKYLACALFPNLPENEVVFTVGGKGVRFDGYDEEMVVIWEDVRADQLRREYSAEGILNLMELYPKKRAYNVKFGKVTLTHQVNIFTTPDENEEDFFKALLIDPRSRKNEAKEEDIEQIKRRFPIVISVGHTEIEIFYNDKIFGSDKNKPSEFKSRKRFWNVNIAELNNISDEASLQAVFDKITAPIVDLYHTFMAQATDNSDKTVKEEAPIDEIMESEDNPDTEVLDAQLKVQYFNFCKDLLNYYRLPNGEFGPYNMYHNIAWVLGDRLTDDYAFARCPMEMDQWKRYGYPVKYSPVLFSSYTKTRIGVIMRNTQDLAESDDEYEDYSNKDRELFSDYVQHMSDATELFLENVSYTSLIKWADVVSESSFLPISDYEIALEDKETWLACWEKTKLACVSSGLISTSQEWYSTFQKALHKIETK